MISEHPQLETWYCDHRLCGDSDGVTAMAASTSDDARQPEGLAAFVVDGEDVYRIELEPPDGDVDPRLWSLATDAVRIE